MATNKHVMSVSELTVNDVMSVYSGKDGKCCCGCAGKHSYNSKFTAEGTKNRGYKVETADVNDAMVKRVLNVVQRAFANDDASAEIGANFASVVVGNRVYIVYPRPSLDVELVAKSRSDVAASVSARVLNLVEQHGTSPVEALRIVCGADVVNAMIDTLYTELRAKAVR